MSDLDADLAARRKKLMEIRRRKKLREQKRAEMQRLLAETEAVASGQNTESALDAKMSASMPVSTGKSKAFATSDVQNIIDSIATKPKQAEVKLEATPVKIRTIAPAPSVIKYDKGIQIELETPMEKSLKDSLQQLNEQIASGAVSVGTATQTQEMKQKEIKTIDEVREEEKRFKAQLLSVEEKKKILDSESFLTFFRRATKVVERTIFQNEDIDVTVDYASIENKSSEKEEAMIKPGKVFSWASKTNKRAITSIMWSPKHHKDLFLVAYAELQERDKELSMDPDGLVLVWSLMTPNRPEYTLTCQSAVLTAQFHPTRPNIIIAGTKSGQVIVWDFSKKSTPVNRTSLSMGHTHPVYAMASIPAVNKAYNILSVSTDGHVCIWQDTEHLEKPDRELDLKFVGRNRADFKDRDITTTTFGFVGRDSNALVLGSDEGVIYKARIYDVPHAAPGIHGAVNAHVAPITNVAFRPPIKGLPTLMNELYLTSSFDWTTKLWHTKSKKPLFSFERCRDYVYDVQWSPVHPALFATGDGNGNLDIWNINTDAELPAETINVKTGKEEKAMGAEKTISKLSFSRDGTKVAVGSSSGSVRIFHLHEKLALPKMTDAKILYENVQTMVKSTGSGSKESKQ